MATPDFEQQFRIFREHGNKFKNRINKLRNPALSNLTAWGEAQDLLGFFVPEYPESFQGFEDVLKEVFEQRRDHYLGRIDTRSYRDEAAQRLDTISTEDLAKLRPAFLCISTLIFSEEKSLRSHRD